MIYRLARHVLQMSTASACDLNCHYHKEGIILALRRKGISVTELQHGLIAPMDIFYVYPPAVAAVRDRALFGDQLWVWGPYWRDLLLTGAEYPPARLAIGGYYNYENPQPTADMEALVSTRTAGGGQVILVATQTMLDAYFVDYVTWLSADLLARGDHSVILVKPHPAEGFTPYESLRACPNVILTLDPVSGLFKLADVLVTIYSTVLYEALRHHLPVYALWVESCAGYVSDILQAGAARRLELRQNPLDLHTESGPAEPERFFSPFQPDMFLHPVAAPVS
jgi:hypothetical protein